MNYSYPRLNARITIKKGKIRLYRSSPLNKFRDLGIIVHLYPALQRKCNPIICTLYRSQHQAISSNFAFRKHDSCSWAAYGNQPQVQSPRTAPLFAYRVLLGVVRIIPRWTQRTRFAMTTRRLDSRVESCSYIIAGEIS